MFAVAIQSSHLTSVRCLVSFSQNQFALAQQLIRLRAPIDLPDNNGVWPIHAAAARGAVQLVAEILNHNAAQVNARTAKGVTPLHAAISKRERYATGLHTLVMGEGAHLMHSCRGYRPMASLLLERGADITATDDAGNQPIHVAASCGTRDPGGRLIS